MKSEFDTEQWRAIRDAKLHGWIGDAYAVEFIVLVGEVCEIWDDLIDEDKELTKNDIHNAFWLLLIDLPLNPFFDSYKGRLIPVITTAVNAWMDANTFEQGSADDKNIAYMLRNLGIELTMFVIYLLHGRDYMRQKSMEIRRFFYHETLNQYLGKL